MNGQSGMKRKQIEGENLNEESGEGDMVREKRGLEMLVVADRRGAQLF
jgi:hypothetical protein